MKISNFSLFALLILSGLLVNSAYQSLKTDKSAPAEVAVPTATAEALASIPAVQTAMVEDEYSEERVAMPNGSSMEVDEEEEEDDEDEE